MTHKTKTVHGTRGNFIEVPDGGNMRAACGVLTTTRSVSTQHKRVTCKRCRQLLGISESWAQKHSRRTKPPVGSKPLHEAGRDLGRRLAEVSLPAARVQLADMRLQYAAAIGLLCELSTRLTRTLERDDDLNSIELAVSDFCELTGWTYRRVLHRIEVFPPQSKGANEHGDKEKSKG